MAFAKLDSRVLAAACGIKELQGFIKSPEITVSKPYYKIEKWDVYPKLLAYHVGRSGIFV
jgi:hypothetical protein